MSLIKSLNYTHSYLNRQILLAQFIFCSSQLVAQKRTEINYFNERPITQNAKIFAEGIISNIEIQHSAPAFSPDGKKVLWAIMKMPSYQMQMLEMNNEHGGWSSPQSPTISDSLADFSFPNFSTQGKTLFFSSNKRIDKNDSLVKGNRLWCVELNNGVWGKPRLVKALENIDGIFANSVAQNGNLYFTHGPHRSPDWNIFFCNEKKDLAPIPLSINTKNYEDGPYISPKEKYLIFESNRPGSIEGSIDLFISFKKRRKWTEPINMGTKINTGFSERFARVSPDGKYLFFGSNRNGNFDVFWIDASIIKELKPKKRMD
jgi:Tol biopolymer transport system component